MPTAAVGDPPGEGPKSWPWRGALGHVHASELGEGARERVGARALERARESERAKEREADVSIGRTVRRDPSTGRLQIGGGVTGRQRHKGGPV